MLFVFIVALGVESSRGDLAERKLHPLFGVVECSTDDAVSRRPRQPRVVVRGGWDLSLRGIYSVTWFTTFYYSFLNSMFCSSRLILILRKPYHHRVDYGMLARLCKIIIRSR